MKAAVFIIIPTVIMLLFGSAFNTSALATRFVDYIADVGGHISEITLTGGHSFDEGFVEGSLAVAYIVSLPLRVVFALFQAIVYTFMYWGVAI